MCGIAIGRFVNSLVFLLKSMEGFVVIVVCMGPRGSPAPSWYYMDREKKRPSKATFVKRARVYLSTIFLLVRDLSCGAWALASAVLVLNLYTRAAVNYCCPCDTNKQ